MPKVEQIINANDLGATVMLNVADASRATAQVLPGDGQALATAVFTKVLGNDQFSLVAPTAPKTISQFGVSEAIDVVGYDWVGLQVTTAEGSNKLVRVILHAE